MKFRSINQFLKPTPRIKKKTLGNYIRPPVVINQATEKVLATESGQVITDENGNAILFEQ